MGRMEKKSIVSNGFLIIRWIVGGIFIYAGASKLLNPAVFSMEISNYHLLHFWGASALAVYLPWLEIVAGTFVIFRKWTLSSLGILFALTLIFLIAICSAWFRGLDISCGCFGHSLDPANYAKLITRDILFLILIATQLIYQRRST